jgi:hypothetical protein
MSLEHPWLLSRQHLVANSTSEALAESFTSAFGLVGTRSGMMSSSHQHKRQKTRGSPSSLPSSQPSLLAELFSTLDRARDQRLAQISAQCEWPWRTARHPLTRRLVPAKASTKSSMDRRTGLRLQHARRLRGSRLPLDMACWFSAASS